MAENNHVGSGPRYRVYYKMPDDTYQGSGTGGPFDLFDSALRFVKREEVRWPKEIFRITAFAGDVVYQTIEAAQPRAGEADTGERGLETALFEESKAHVLMTQDYEALFAEWEQLRAEVEGLRSALKPFARMKYTEGFERMNDLYVIVLKYAPDQPDEAVCITAGDIRRAAASSEEGKG